MKQAHEIISTLNNLGVTVGAQGDNLVVIPKSKVPAELVEELRQHKTELMALLGASISCICVRPVGPAGCSADYPVCSACRYTWYCKDCGGCRQCASPVRKVKTILPTQPHRRVIDDKTRPPQAR